MSVVLLVLSVLKVTQEQLVLLVQRDSHCLVLLVLLAHKDLPE